MDVAWVSVSWLFSSISLSELIEDWRRISNSEEPELELTPDLAAVADFIWELRWLDDIGLSIWFLSFGSCKMYKGFDFFLLDCTSGNWCWYSVNFQQCYKISMKLNLHKKEEIPYPTCHGSQTTGCQRITHFCCYCHHDQKWMIDQSLLCEMKSWSHFLFGQKTVRTK